jgi:2-dehydropantoate 2-reductase
MHFLIYGAGALGQALGCMLAADGHHVDLVLRERFLDIIEEKGLRVSGIFGDYHVQADRIGLLTGITDADGSRYDYILMTTKSYDTGSAVADIATLKNCNCPVASMQNGCGNVEQLVHHLGDKRSLGARIITGFEITQPASVRITVSADDIHIGGSQAGHISKAIEILASAIARAGLPCVAVEDIHQSLFAKLLYNCALNPLGAILGVNYGKLSESGETRAIMNNVIDETFQVIRAIGGTLPWESGDQFRKLFYDELIPATYNHRPSMLQDLENNKPTEVEALVGYVSARGKEKGVATPCCSQLASLIRYREQ